jgi:triacylglycerol lipase
VEVIIASVPPSGSIEERAEKLGKDIAAKADGKSVNIVAHSMGGLDARYMISNLKPKNVNVKSLVTIATPHHGSAFADYLLEDTGPINLPRLYGVIEKAGFGTKAFGQLTRKYMAEEFNPRTPDEPNVRYFSYGAVTSQPPLLSPFRQSHKILDRLEGPNDGLVSVESSRWGSYKGTLVNVSHLDLINWSNRLRWTVRRWFGGQDKTYECPVVRRLLPKHADSLQVQCHRLLFGHCRHAVERRSVNPGDRVGTDLTRLASLRAFRFDFGGSRRG